MFCAEFGGQKNQFGMAAADTRELGPSFLALALNKDARKGTICLATIEDAKALTKELGH